LATGCSDDDSGGTDIDAAVDAADVDATDTDSGPDIDAETDGEVEIDGETPQTTTVEGRVWLYYYTDLNDSHLGLDWATGATVETVGLAQEISTTTATGMNGGTFRLENVPLGETIYLRASGLQDTTNGVSALFTVEEDMLIFMVVATEHLVTQISTAWNVNQQNGRGMLAGVVAEWDPTADPPIQAFIGDATVAISPEPSGQNYQFVYFDPTNLGNTTLTATHADQSLFFGVSVPPADATNPYSTTTAVDFYDFEDVQFPVEADALTYVVIDGTPN
jgi:hypothetical protein